MLVFFFAAQIYPLRAYILLENRTDFIASDGRRIEMWMFNVEFTRSCSSPTAHMHSIMLVAGLFAFLVDWWIKITCGAYRVHFPLALFLELLVFRV